MPTFYSSTTATSRTSRSIKNSIVALCYYAVNLCLQFMSRKIFLDHLGTEILGLNTTAVNLLQFLNLAELGVSAGVSFTLFKPIANKDIISINEIITLQGYLYRRIAFIIIAGAAILMLFFPFIFEKISLPLWYAYASFGVLLLSALLGYFINYQQVVLTASQQDYKIMFSYRTVILLKLCAQMIAVKYLLHGYEWWLILEASFAIIGSGSLAWMTKRTFPFLKKSTLSFKELRQKHWILTVKIKQLFFHKIGGFALTQSSPLIIYAFTSLSIVALYGNYVIIITGIKSLVGAIFNSLTAGVGNLVAEDNQDNIRKVFSELFSVRFLIVSILCFMTFNYTPEFIEIWIGKEYLLPVSTLLILTITLYIETFRYTIDNFINAFGLYGDIYAPLCEASLNICLSILFGLNWGLNGVLLGVLVSQIIVIALWKPYYLFHSCMKGFGKKYFQMYIKHILILGITWIIMTNLLSIIHFDNYPIIGIFILRGIIECLFFGTLLSFLMIIFNTPLKSFISRIKIITNGRNSA